MLYSDAFGPVAVLDLRRMVAGMGAVPDLDLRRIRVFCEEKTPPELRDQMQLEVGVRGKSVTVFECRPAWNEQGDRMDQDADRAAPFRSGQRTMDPLLG